MQVKIGGKEYAFEVRGDVGIHYTAEMMLRKVGVIGKDETIDYRDGYQWCVLLYSALSLCNKTVMAFDEFMSVLTGETLRAMTEEMNASLLRLSGAKAEEEEEKSEEKTEGNA